jgi:hypothetical protein
MPSPSCNRFDVLAARNRCPPATRAPTQFDGPNLRDAVGAHRGLILIETNNVGSRAVAGARLICRPRPNGTYLSHRGMGARAQEVER